MRITLWGYRADWGFLDGPIRLSGATQAAQVSREREGWATLRLPAGRQPDAIERACVMRRGGASDEAIEAIVADRCPNGRSLIRDLGLVGEGGGA